MLSINMDDVMQVVSNIQNYLIAFGVVLVLALLVMFAVRKMPKAKKKMIRAQSGLAILLELAIVTTSSAPAPCPPCWTWSPAKVPSVRRLPQRPPSWSTRSPRKASFWLRTTATSCPVASRLQAERLRLGFHQPLLWRHRFRRSERRLPCHRPAHRSA